MKNHSTDFLIYLKQLKIELGTTILVKDIKEFDKSMEVLIDNELKQNLSNKVTENLYIKTT